MRTALLILLCVAVIHCNVLTPYITPGEYMTNKTVVPGYTLCWNINAAKNEIEFGIIAKASGWIALGFGASDGMTNADVIIGYYDQTTQKAVVHDAYIAKIGTPPILDVNNEGGKDDIIASNGGYTNGETHLKFIRKMNVTEQKDPWDTSINAGQTAVSIAFQKESTDLKVAHSQRARLVITFIKPKFPPIRFQYYITGAVILVTILLGLFTTGALLPARYKVNRVTHLLLYKRLSQFSNNKLFRWFDHVADLTIGELYMITMYLVLCVTWFMQEYIGAIRWVEPSPWGRGLAWITIVNLSFILLPVTRNSVWFYIFGISYEKALRFHRGIARWNLLTMALHGVIMLWEYGWKQAWVYDDISGKYTLAGTLSWVLLSIGAILGYEPIRKRIFRWFVATHVILGMISFVAIIIHAKWNQTVPFMAFGFGMYVLDLIMRIVFGICVPATLVDAQYLEKAGVTKLVIKKKSLRKFKPGQHVYVWIGDISKTEWHPFSISNVHEDGSFVLYVKNMGQGVKEGEDKWTHKLATWAQNLEPVGFTATQIRIEGPYGNAPHEFDQYETVVLVAGGIGITALYGMFQDLVSKNKKVLLVWSTKSKEMWSLYEDLVHEEASFGDSAEVRLHLTTQEMTDSNTIGNGVVICPGRIDFNRLLADVGKVASKDGFVSVCACGPEEMARDIRMACWNQSKNGLRFHYYKQLFSL